MEQPKDKKIRIVSVRESRILTILLVGVAILFVISINQLKLNFGGGMDNFRLAAGYLGQMFQMNFSEWRDILAAAATSFAVAILATILSAAAAFLFCFSAAKNLSPSVIVNAIRGAAAIMRAVPTLVWTLIFVAYVGLGPFAGVLGLFLHSFAYLIKAYSESIELIDDNNLEALRATGASWLQVITHGVLPPTITSFISWTALRFEINVAESTVLGMVGAGGIGFELSRAMRNYDFNTGGFVVLVIFLMSFSIEMIFHRLKLNVDREAMS